MSEVINFTNLRIEMNHDAGQATWRFVGDIDEHFRQKDVPRLRRLKITLVLEDVGSLNSVGIREWIYLIRAFGELGALVFSRCSVAVVDQINTIPESLGNGLVESFYAPYYCQCGAEVNQLIVVAKHREQLRLQQAPSFLCAKCGEKLEFDSLEKSYFMFLDEAQRPGAIRAESV